jgi:hypothetical protein
MSFAKCMMPSSKANPIISTTLASTTP